MQKWIATEICHPIKPPTEHSGTLFNLPSWYPGVICFQGVWAGVQRSLATQTSRALFHRSPSCWRTCSPQNSIWTSYGWWRRCDWSSVCSSGSLRRMWRRWVSSRQFFSSVTKIDTDRLGCGQKWLVMFLFYLFIVSLYSYIKSISLHAYTYNRHMKILSHQL